MHPFIPETFCLQTLQFTQRFQYEYKYKEIIIPSLWFFLLIHHFLPNCVFFFPPIQQKHFCSRDNWSLDFQILQLKGFKARACGVYWNCSQARLRTDYILNFYYSFFFFFIHKYSLFKFLILRLRPMVYRTIWSTLTFIDGFYGGLIMLTTNDTLSLSWFSLTANIDCPIIIIVALVYNVYTLTH